MIVIVFVHLQGTYSPGGLTSCIICPAGMECSSTSISNGTECNPGYFSTGGQMVK